MVQFEDLIKATGGCGRFQIILTVIVHSMKCVVCFSTVFMVYGAVTPNWWCVQGSLGNFTLSDKVFKACSFGNVTSCTKFKFEDTANTIVTQWSLVCDNEWIPSAITSLQMAGVVIGNLVCGHVADLIGRKPPLFLSLLALIISNTAATFSSSWITFAIIRFIIGVEIGFEITVRYNILSEFTLARWRTWVVAIPSWAIEVALFAVVSWLINDWRYLHYVTAAIGLPLLACYWIVHGMASFGMQFGVSALSGNVYINMFIIGLIGSPVQLILIPFQNRNIGYGFQSTLARIGAVIGPQLVYVDTRVPGLMYWICGVTAVISIFLLWPVPETMGADLPDMLGDVEGHSNRQTIDMLDSHSSNEIVSEKSGLVIIKT